MYDTHRVIIYCSEARACECTAFFSFIFITVFFFSPKDYVCAHIIYACVYNIHSHQSYARPRLFIATANPQRNNTTYYIKYIGCTHIGNAATNPITWKRFRSNNNCIVYKLTHTNTEFGLRVYNVKKYLTGT